MKWVWWPPPSTWEHLLIYNYRTWFDILSAMSIHSLGEWPNSENSNVLKPVLNFSLHLPSLSHYFLRGPCKGEIWMSNSRCHGCSTPKQGIKCTFRPWLFCIASRGCCSLCCSPNLFTQLPITWHWFHIKNFLEEALFQREVLNI